MSQSSEATPRVPNLGRFRMGEWEVNQAENTLCSGERSAHLEPRVMDVLAYLASEPERVVTKEELLSAVWGGVFVEEGALTQAVHSLRKVLGDDARQPRYIQTIPKRGYRLVAKVATAPEPESVSFEEPQGTPSTSPVPPLRPASPRGLAWVVLAVAGVAMILALSLSGRQHLDEARTVAAKPPARDSAAVAHDGLRIAVLPFVDLGEPEDQVFTSGLTLEITKDLGSLSFLQVIDRTGPLGKEPPKPLEEIRKEFAALEIDYILMGTVQWGQRTDRPRVRITPKLIQIDGLLVSLGSYDTEIEDLFKVQAEISEQVITALSFELLPEQSLALRKPSTESFDAHQAYIRGLELKDQPFYSHDFLEKAARMFQRAVDLDPGFAAAWAELSQVSSYLAYNTDPSPERKNTAWAALEKALTLNPDLPEVKLAQAYYVYRCQENFDSALAQLKVAADLHPNNAEIFKAFGLLLRRKGRVPEAIKALKHAAWLDPNTGELVWILPETHRAMRNFKEADEGFDQAISQAPDEPFFWEQKTLNWLAWTGDVEQARYILDESGLAGRPEIEAAAFRLDLYEGKYDQALERLSPKWVEELPPETQARIAMAAAIARERLGDHEGALAAAEANRIVLEAKVARLPNLAFFRACLAVALAQLGRREEALEEAQEAVRLSGGDAFSGPRIVEIQAMVDAILGRELEAIDRLSQLRSMSYRGSVTTADLRHDPIWERLQGYSRFQALLKAG